MATLIRLLLLLAPWKPPQEIHYLQSALFDPTYTLTYWKEAHSLKFLFLSHDLTKMYESSQCKLPPLVLLGLEAVYRWVCQGNDFALHVLVGIFIIILDGIIAVMLSDVATWALDEDDRREGEIQSNMPKAVRPALGHIFPLPGQTNKPSIIKRGEVSSVISMMYYASPLVTLSSFFGVFSSIEVGLLVAATWCASRGSQREKDAAVCLSMLFYWDIAAMFYAVPIALMLDGRASRRRFVAILLLGSFILHGVSMILESDHHWSSVVMRPYDFWKVSPSLSVQWYLSMQVFPRFVNYFRYILFGLPTITVIPLMTRLEQYPVTLLSIFWILWRMFRSHGTLLDWNMSLTLLLLSPASLARARKIPCLVALCAFPVPFLLYVVDLWMWLEVGSEANFVYFQCLAFQVLGSVLVLEFVRGSLHRAKANRETLKLMTKNK